MKDGGELNGKLQQARSFSHSPKATSKGERDMEQFLW